MSRLAVLALLLAACGKSAPKDTGGATDPALNASAGGGGGEEMVKVPGGTPPPNMKGGNDVAPPPGGADPQKLAADEGKLAIEAPTDAKAGAELTAKITLTPGAGFHVNTEFPIKLKLTAPDGVALAKTEYKAGGSGKDKGDADVLEEPQLLLTVKMTPAKSGSYTINGDFKFAVCDKDSCRPKHESIAIQIAAK